MKRSPFHVGIDFGSVLGANLAPFWAPRCFQDGHFGPPRCPLFGFLFSMSFWIDFWPLLGPILAPTWAQLGAPKQPWSAPERPRKASWKHLGSRNRPRPAQTPSGPPSGVDFRTLGGRFWGPFRCIFDWFGRVWGPLRALHNASKTTISAPPTCLLYSF